MDKIKNKYELLVGFAAVFISFSSFKEELSQVVVNLGFISFSLTQYFLVLVVSFSISLYLYVTENTVRDFAVGRYKIFGYCLYVAYFLFIVALSSPIVVLITLGVYRLYLLLPTRFNLNWEIISTILPMLASFLSLLFAFRSTQTHFEMKKAVETRWLYEQEIKDLDNAVRLFNDKYYSLSVLESYKVLESYLFQKLHERDIRVSRNRINDILNLSLRNEIISKDDLSKINQIRLMRNAAAHTDAEHTLREAEFALRFVRSLLVRDNKMAAKDGQ